MGYFKNLAIEAEEQKILDEQDGLLADGPEGECPECFGFGFTMVQDEELGEVRCGCFTCWHNALDADMVANEELLRQQHAAAHAAYEMEAA